MSIMKKVILIASSLAFFFACSEEKTEANYNRCPQATADDVVNTVQDIDGNQYKVVKIGDYEWFASNLKTTKLADGTAIENVAAEEDWANTTAPAYSTYNNEDGAEVLYNYAAVQANPCPEGWYVPADSVWLQVAATYAGIVDSTGWDKVPTTIGWDNTSFSAKAAGFRERNGKFYEEGKETVEYKLNYASHAQGEVIEELFKESEVVSAKQKKAKLKATDKLGQAYGF